MKKLMIALAAAATTMLSFGAASSFEVSGTSFEGYPTNILQTAKDDVAGNSGDNYWYTTDQDAENIISNYFGYGETDAKEIPIASRPDYFAPSNNTKFLQLETTGKLFRSAMPNGQTTEFTPVEIPDQGIYLDTLVKFTAADDVFGADAIETGIDKIAIEYVEREADETAGIPALTNFVVRAGFIGSELFVTNYAVALPAGWIENNKKDDWHRLTVRALTDVDGHGSVGFKIYLDENVLSYVTDNGEFAQSSGIDDATHTIFPSAVGTDENNYSDISAVAFSGNGSIDDVVFTTAMPAFIKNSEEVVVPFVADAGVTAISVSVAGVTDPISVVNDVATLPAGTTAFTVNVTVDTANGYTLGGISYGGTPVVDGEVTGYAGGDITVTTIRNNFNLFDADGDPISGTFQKLSEVLETEGVAKIVLAHSYNVAENEGNEFVTYNIDSDITLDLNGNTITGGGDDALFTVGSGVTMIVIDSLAANTGKIDYTGTYAVFYSEGDVVIGATTGDYGPTIDGYLAAADDEGDGIWLIKGKIEAVTNSDGGAFLWDGYLGNSEGTITSDADLDSDEEYWVVTPQGGSTTFALTTTGGANATVTTDPADVSALTGETEVTITATPETGYTYNGVDLTDTGFTYDSESGTISRTLTVTTDTEVAVPGAVAQQLGTYTVTVTPTANATYAAAYKSDDSAIEPVEDVLTVTVGQTIVITATPAEGYEYAETPTDWTAGQDGEITIEVSEAGTVAIPAPTEKGGKTYPSYIPDDATEKGKYDTWKAAMTAAGVDVGNGEAYEDAYLLNCKPAEVTAEAAAFKFTSISYDTTQSKWITTTTTKNTKGADYNGTVTVTGYSDVGCTVGNETEAGPFFKASLQ